MTPYHDTSPPALSRETLERATFRLARTIVLLEISGEIAGERASESIRLCLQLASDMAHMSVGAPARVVLASLVQIELTLGQLQRVLSPVADSTARAALGEIERLLAAPPGTPQYAVRKHLVAQLRAER